MVNGTSLYSVGLHDFMKIGVHPGASVLPAMIAVGEWQASKGSDMLAAMVAGYEVVERVGRAIQPGHRERGWHGTGTCGTFAATAVAGRLLGLSASQLACAFGIAGSQAAGLFECLADGSSVLVFHAGRAGQNGIEAVMLTQAGLTGPATILEGERGFFRAYGDKVNADVFGGLGSRFAVHDVSFRPCFGVTSTIAAIGAILDILKRRGGIGFAELARIVVRCNPVVARDNAEANPQTLVGARMSVPFNVAMAFARGEPMMRDLEDEDLHDPRIREVLPLIELAVDPACPRFGCTLEVSLRSGESERLQMNSWHGEAAETFSWADVRDKFDRLTGTVLSKEDGVMIADTVMNLEKLDGAILASRLARAVSNGRAKVVRPSSNQ